MRSIQVTLTPAAGKQLIALALSRNSALLHALQNNTVAVVAGTTNTYIAKALLALIGENFDGKHFFRGITRAQPLPEDLPPFGGDVIIEKGKWIRGMTIQEAAPAMKAGDVILKGANAVDLKTGEAAVLIGHSEGGTLASIWQANVGRRATVMIPAGVEKRVDGPIAELCRLCNDGEAGGARLAAAPGKAYTELDAIAELTGAKATLIAAGGVCGCEGAAWFQCEGTDEQLALVKEYVQQVQDTPLFAF